MKLGNVTISITNRCNYLCKHCSFDSGKKKIEECSVTEWAKFLEQAKYLGARKLDISGGEPAIRKDLSELVSTAKSFGYEVKLLTNGSFLTDTRLEELKSAGLDAIAISLDGPNSRVHNYIRLKGEEDFNDTLDAIRRVKKYGFFTKVNSVLFSSNLRHISDLIKLIQTLGADEYRICYFTPTGRGQNLTGCADPVEWLDTIRNDLVRFEEDARIYVGVPYLENDRNLDTLCYTSQGILPLHVLPNGDIYSCSIQTGIGTPIGNIKDKLQEVTSNSKQTEGCCFDYANCLKAPSREKFCQVCPLKKFKLQDLK